MKEEMTMKKMITNMKALAALLMVGAAVTSCSSDDSIIDEPDAPQVYTMTVEASKGTNGTRALADGGSTLTSTWSVDDVVEVWKADGTTKYGVLTAQTAGASTTLRGTLSSPLPSNGDELTLKYLSPDYDTQDGTLTGSAKSIDKVCDYATATVTATVSGTSVTTTTASFVNQQAVVKFTLKDNAATPNAISPTALTVSDGTHTVSLTIPDATYTTNGDGVVYVAIPGFSGKTVSLSATVGSDTYTYDRASVTFENGNFYRITVKMKQAASAPAGAEAVDLGLSVKWANMNVGATSETDYGKYYAWGATTDNYSESKDYNWTNTPYYTGNGSTHSWSKYTSAPATLDVATDDAARANCGGSWRMPTETEFQELLDNTTRSWQTNYKGVSGCNGYLFTSKIDGYTDKSIFLPAAGCINADSPSAVGMWGYYWSSTLNSDGVNDGRYLDFDSDNAGMYSNCRYLGFTVRAVQ